MRWAGLFVLLLAGCSTGTTGLSISQPGLDVARAALRGGSPQVALQVTNDLLQRHPDDEPVLIVQGDALTDLGQFDSAALDYTKVLKRDPTSVDAHIGLGRLRLPTDPAAAEGLFLEALQHDPRNTTALNDLGIARDLQGHHADAQRAYAEALGIDPELRAAQVNLALSLAMSGDSHRALTLLQPLAAQPDASRKLRHDLAAVLAMGGKEAEAERILSADLTPQQIQQALADYVAARRGAGAAPMPPTELVAPRQAVPPAPTRAAPPALAPAQPQAARQPLASQPPPRPSTRVTSPQTPAPVTPPVETPTRTQLPPATTPPVPPSAATMPPAQPSPADTPPGEASPAKPQSQSANDPADPQVQLTAVPTEQDAQAAWHHLADRMPKLLDDRQPMFLKVVSGDQTFWRLRTGGFAKVAEAEAFCVQIRAAGSPCVAYGK